MEGALESRDASSGEQSRAWPAALRSEGVERDRATLAGAGLNSAVG
jgi:hypothetical protein